MIVSPSYKIIVEDSIVRITASGNQTIDSIKVMREAVEPVMFNRNTPDDVLICLEGEGVLTTQCALSALSFLQEVPFNRIALIGKFPGPLRTAKSIADVSNVREKVKFFRTEDDARAWLSEATQ